MANKKKTERYEASISKRGSKGEKIDFELIAYIKSCLEEKDVEKARKILNSNKDYIKKKTYKRWKKQIELVENNKCDNTRLLPKAMKFAISLFVSIIFYSLTFVIECNLYEVNKLLRTGCFIVNLVIQWKVNSIVKWSFINRYGYKFSMDGYEGMGLAFWCLNLAFCIFLF